MNFRAEGFDEKSPTAASSTTPSHDIVSSSEPQRDSTNPAGQAVPMTNFGLPFISSLPSSSSSMMIMSGGGVQVPVVPGQMPANLRVSQPLPTSSPTVRSSTDIYTPHMELSNEAMWADFHRLTNEMVVCRTGRKMFPKIEIKVSGLNANMNYFIVLSMRLVDSNRYKFQAGAWSTAGYDAVPEWSNVITHHESLNGSGEFWMRNTISFDRVKLTNTPKAEGSMISLASMHKYQPVLQLFSCKSENLSSEKPLIVLEPPVLQFIAVTAYQNEAITRLKIAYNPFAKGFREGSSRKRSYSPGPDESSHSGLLVSPPMKRADSILPQFNAAAFMPFSTAGFTPNFNFNQLPSQAMFNFNNSHLSSVGISSITNNITPTNGGSLVMAPNVHPAVGPTDYVNMFSGLDALTNTVGYNQLFGGHLPAYLTSSLVSQAGAAPSAAMIATMLAANQSSFQQQYQQLAVSRISDNSAGDETSASPSTDNDNSLSTLPSPSVPKTLEE